jgi:hypothetical protein
MLRHGQTVDYTSGMKADLGCYSGASYSEREAASQGVREGEASVLHSFHMSVCNEPGDRNMDNAKGAARVDVNFLQR